MAVPPPPAPPAPPPAPIAKLGGSSGGGDARSALLQSIQKGTKLKKTVTVDKSGPAIAGKLVSDAGAPVRAAGKPPDDAPKLAGIFGGMSSMPKLKPVGSRGPGQVSPLSPAKDVVDSDGSRSERVNDTVALDFNSELTKHLTLKKQKQQKGVTEANLKINRGPPPNPPLKTSTITPPDSDASRSAPSHSPEARRYPSAATEVISSSAVANKSSLFNNMGSQSQQMHKPNHGKPNLAPKPPGAPPGSVGKSVARHHSMKSPRSPPVTPSNLGGPVFPTGSHFGTLRGTQQLFQSQESIHVNGRPSGRPTVAPPPRPPASRPPPPPIRSVSNTNLSNLPSGSLSTPIADPQANSSSLNNVSALKEQLKTQIPLAGTLSRPSEPKNASNVPPVPPQRHSSIRNSSGTSMSGTYGGETATVESNGRLVVDLEARYAVMFRSVTEFPRPQPFANIPKIYASSHTSRTSNVGESRKQRAPKPPIQQQCSPKLNEYNYYSREISNC
ncbi:WAS/WASL-interacting protein family member 1 isoform X2 [Phlebotomus argentipes]|uniref:WAS/WASL-interacting protein family member 1 isoform X2 n=1 Tax=Phlebotomus argentipes TaxID=94469 RepID=UPI0028932A3C|nr:WAS/WASL-interacting protein family member 1 isoform X2 [Phlebotomus argentipes]